MRVSLPFGADMNQFILIPVADFAALQEAARANTVDVRALLTRCEQLEAVVEHLAGNAGALTLPNAAAPQPIPAIPAVNYARAVQTNAARFSNEGQGEQVAPDNVSQYRYVIKRGGSGPTYADAVAFVVDEPEFDLEYAWLMVQPLIAPPHPDDWRHSLRRSLRTDRKGRFEEIEGRKDWFRRVAGNPRALGVEGMGEDDGQENEPANGALTPKAGSEDRFGGHLNGGDGPRLELNP
ncbi:MAG TPA: hypothetical protein VF263_06005 [Longimicrobiaceae bacterium]